MTASDDRRESWVPPARADWVEALNAEGRGMDIRAMVPLDAESLIATATRSTGLADFGEPGWEEPFRVLVRALDEEAELTLTGRLMCRAEMLVFLQNRLQIEDCYRRHPEIDEEQIREPLFIAGLPRSGTSILFELLAQDPQFAIPETWMLLYSCPPPATATAGDVADRIRRADHLVTQWARVVPAYASMHEMGGRIPSECGMIMANTFLSEHFPALQQTPSYDAWLFTHDWDLAYRYHRRVLKLLQWQSGGNTRWLLKAPNHLGHLPTLFATYPDARVVQTHRDPLKCMASATNLLGCLYWMRSDKAFDSSAFEDLIMGSATASRLANVMRQREEGVVPATRVADSRYQDLMDDPLAAVSELYRRLGSTLGEEAAARMQAYIAAKPKGKFGVHRYEAGDADFQARERALFADYQARFGVPDER
jgi:hypothetical protein